MHLAMSGKPRPEVSRWRIHEAACRALELEPMPPAAVHTRPAAVRTRLSGSRLLRLFRS
jgi:hypothetical protein